MQHETKVDLDTHSYDPCDIHRGFPMDQLQIRCDLSCVRNLEKLEVYAQNCMEDPGTYVNYNGWNTSYRTHYDAVVYQISYLGFGSQANEKGFYYSPDGQPKDFGCDLRQEQREHQILFLGEGDNYVLTEQIAPNWFWYEQHW